MSLWMAASQAAALPRSATILSPALIGFSPSPCQRLGKNNRRWSTYLDSCQPREKARRSSWLRPGAGSFANSDRFSHLRVTQWKKDLSLHLTPFLCNSAYEVNKKKINQSFNKNRISLQSWSFTCNSRFQVQIGVVIFWEILVSKNWLLKVEGV